MNVNSMKETRVLTPKGLKEKDDIVENIVKNWKKVSLEECG